MESFLIKQIMLSTYLFQKIRCSTAQKIEFSIKDFFSKCDQIRSFLRIWLHLLKKSLMENVIFCAVLRASEHLMRASYLLEKICLDDTLCLIKNNSIDSSRQRHKSIKSIYDHLLLINESYFLLLIHILNLK